MENQVLARSFQPGKRSLEGKILEKVGAVTYRVQVEAGIVWRHADHLRVDLRIREQSDEEALPEWRLPAPRMEVGQKLVPAMMEDNQGGAGAVQEAAVETPVLAQEPGVEDPTSPTQPRRGIRERKTPKHLDAYQC